MSVQSEAACQLTVRSIHPAGGVLFNGFCKGVQKRIPCGFNKLLVSGVLELLEDRHNVAAVDCSQLCRSDDAAAGFIIVFQIDDLQILADCFHVPFDEIVKEFITLRQKGQLRCLQAFKFTRHSRYNLPAARLKALEQFIQKRVGKLLEF